MYYISMLRVMSGKSTVSEHPFEPGLNIVYGVSESGKSLIVECIDFMFGGKPKKLKKASLEVHAVSITLDVDGKELTIYREIDKNEMIVTGDVEGIEYGTYTAGSGSKKTPPINKLWLHLMGIDIPDVEKDQDGILIYQYKNKSKQSLTLRTFVHSFLINVGRMEGENTILYNGNGYSDNIPVSTITSLLYLATEKNFIPDGEPKKVDGEPIIKAKKSATEKLYSLSIAALEKQDFVACPAPKDNKRVPELEREIDMILGSIEEAEGQLKDALEENKEIGSKILKIQRKMLECNHLNDRFASLRSQYESDIRRMTFVAEGEIHKETVEKIEYCPFCNGELSKEKSESCVEAAIAEVDKIRTQISELQSAAISIQHEMESLSEKRAALFRRKEEIDISIRGELRPQVDSLRDKLSEFTAALEHAKAKELVKSFGKILQEKMDEVIDEAQAENIFDVESVIKEYLKKPMDERLSDILEKTNFRHFISASFEISNCDVKVNGNEKMMHGQGFIAYLNTVMAIAVQEVIDSFDLHRLPLLVIDSPVMSLVEKEEDTTEGGSTDVATNGMKVGLFQYMIDHRNDRQTIVIENKLPQGPEYEKINLIHFTLKENVGTYGLIKDHRE